MVRNSGAILASHPAAMLERLRTGDGGATLLNYDNHRSREGAGLAAGQGRDRSPGLFVDGPLVAGTDGAVHGLDYARQTLAECGGGAGLLVGSQHGGLRHSAVAAVRRAAGDGHALVGPPPASSRTSSACSKPASARGGEAQDLHRAGDGRGRALAVFVRQDRISPEHPPTTGEGLHGIARLGGFLGRKGDGEPGPEVLWRDLAKLRPLAEAWRAFQTKRCG